MRPTLQVRRLDADDVELAVRAIQELKPEVEAGSARDEGTMATWLSDESHVLLVAAEGKSPVGFALGYLLQRVGEPAPMLFFYEIEVAEGVRQRGIGSKLVCAMKLIAGQAGACKMWVQTSPDNVAAHALYRSQGAVRSPEPDCVYSWCDLPKSQVDDC